MTTAASTRVREKPVESLEGFRFDRLLSEDGRSKAVAVLGSFDGKEGNAVVLLSKSHFELQKLQHTVSKSSSLTKLFENDIYTKEMDVQFSGTAPIEDNVILLDLIYPATAKHISKYTAQNHVLFEMQISEAPEQYKTVTLPYICQLPASRTQWVYNILDKKSEVDRIIYEDEDAETGFVLLPDQKWDEQQIEGLYLQAILCRRDIRSIRDLRAHHLPLLRNIESKSKKVVRDKYGVEPRELRLWCHYQPSYYHFHVHCAHSKWDGPGLQAGKAILLEDIIDNISTMDGDFYAKKTMTFSLGDKDPLLQCFQDATIS